MYTHRTVLLDEAVDGLITDPDGLYLDGTFGRGGHSRLILSRLGPKGRLIAFDKDPEAIREAGTITDPRFAIEHRSFAEMRDAMAEQLQVEWSVPETYVADDPMNKLQKLTPKEIVEEAIEIVTAVKED